MDGHGFFKPCSDLATGYAGSVRISVSFFFFCGTLVEFFG